MQNKTYATLAVSCLALLLANGALAGERPAPSAPPSATAEAAPTSAPLVDEAGQAIDENGDAVAFEYLPAIAAGEFDYAPLVDENGQAVDADGNAIAFEDLPAISTDAALLVDENGQAVDADGNVIAVEDLPPPRTLVEWFSRQNFGQLFGFGE